MRVCVIHSIFPPYARGGAEHVAQALARIWPDDEVFVISAAPFENSGSLAGKWETIGGMRIFRFTPFNLFSIFSIAKYSTLLRLIWHVLDMFNLHTYLVVRRILREQKPDLIITRNLKGLGYTVPLAIRKSKIKNPKSKWIHTIHDASLLHPRGFMEFGKEDALRKPNPLVRLYRAAARQLFGSPDAVVAPSQFILDEYNAAQFFPKSKKYVVPNPIIDIESNPSQPPLKVRGGEGGVMRFLYVGQLEPYKGIKILLSAWQEFVRENPNAILEIVGQGSMQDEVERASRMIKGIYYRGFVPHEQLTQVFTNATAVIFPTLAYESFGLVVIESFAAGVPVIASRIGALEEIIEDGRQGILISPGDRIELLDAMRILVKDSAALASAARARAADFSLANFQKRLHGVYKELT